MKQAVPWWFFFPDVTFHYLMWLFCIAAVPWGWCDFSRLMWLKYGASTVVLVATHSVATIKTHTPETSKIFEAIPNDRKWSLGRLPSFALRLLQAMSTLTSHLADIAAPTRPWLPRRQRNGTVTTPLGPVGPLVISCHVAIISSSPKVSMWRQLLVFACHVKAWCVVKGWWLDFFLCSKAAKSLHAAIEVQCDRSSICDNILLSVDVFFAKYVSSLQPI